MSRNWFYRSGSWNLLCDVCAKKIKAEDSRKRWDGFITCPSCYEVRHPQDFIRARTDKIVVPYTRPQPTDQFVQIDATRANNDSLTITDDFSKELNLIVQSFLVTTADTANQALGNFSLGEYPLAGQGSSQGYTEQLVLSEAVLIGYDVIKSPTDSFGFTEAFVKADSEDGAVDIMSLSEAVTVATYINNALGETTLGASSLG